MTKLADDPKTLAKLIASLGGTVIDGDTFRFDLPVRDVREAVPKINAMGLGVRKISERVAQDQNGTHNVMTLALYKPAKKENDIERVMRARGIG
jgi:hypothetical protein